MIKTSTITNLIIVTAQWIAVLLPLLIAAGRGVADAGATTLAVLFLVHVLTAKDFRFLKEKWVIASLVLWLYLIARSLFASETELALRKSLPFIRLILFAACMEFVVSKDPRAVTRIFKATMLALAFLVADGFVQYFIGHDVFGKVAKSCNRLTGPYSNMVLGATIATLGTIVIAGLIPLLKKSKSYLLAIIITCVLTYAIVFLSGERAAFIRLVVSTALLWLALLLKAQDLKTKKNLYMLAFALFIFFACLQLSLSFFVPGMSDRQGKSVLNEVTNHTTSPYIFLWHTGIKAGLSNILFGIGPNHFKAFCYANPHPVMGYCADAATRSDHPHNTLIELFAESGLVGLGLFMWALYALGMKLLKFCQSRSNIFECALALGAGLAALQRLMPVPSSGFLKSWYAIPMWFAIGLMLCIVQTQSSKVRRH